MSRPINLPQWIIKSRRGVTGDVVGPERSQVKRLSPKEAEAVLRQHARQLAIENGLQPGEVTKDQAQDDLNYRSKTFRSYLPEVRAKRKAAHEANIRAEVEQIDTKPTTTE